MRMRFYCEHLDWQGNLESSVEVVSNSEELEQVLGDFESFLRGCGYLIEGELHIVNQEESYDKPSLPSVD